MKCVVRRYSIVAWGLDRAPKEVDLRSKGVKTAKGPLTYKEDRDRYLYFEDPDRNMIELVASTIGGWPASILRLRAETYTAIVATRRSAPGLSGGLSRPPGTAVPSGCEAPQSPGSSLA